MSDKDYRYTYHQGVIKTSLNEYKKKVPKVKKVIKEAYAGGAWWFRKKGTEPLDVSNSNHIALVIEQPETFGLTMEEIKKWYKKYDERIGSEGKAREEIIRYLVKQGWIRVRHYVGRNDYWSFTVNNFKSRKKDLQEFCWDMILEKKMSEGDSVVFYSTSEDKTYQYAFQQGGVKGFLNEKKKKKKNILKNILEEFKAEY